jgi:AcrR family transcriptional regulator
MVLNRATAASSSEMTKPQTQLRIQEAAVRLFAAKGFEGTGIREIADQAGIQTSALYHYMDSKEDLLVDIMVSILGRLIASAKCALEVATNPPAQLIALVRAHVGLHAFARLDAIVGDGELRALGAASRAQVVGLRDDYEDLWAVVLAGGREGQVFDFDDPKITRLALLEMCNGVSHWYSEAGSLAVEDVADAFAELALSLVGAQVGGRRLRLADVDSPPVTEVLVIVRQILESDLAPA